MARRGRSGRHFASRCLNQSAPSWLCILKRGILQPRALKFKTSQFCLGRVASPYNGPACRASCPSFALILELIRPLSVSRAAVWATMGRCFAAPARCEGRIQEEIEGRGMPHFLPDFRRKGTRVAYTGALREGRRLRGARASWRFERRGPVMRHSPGQSCTQGSMKGVPGPAHLL